MGENKGQKHQAYFPLKKKKKNKTKSNLQLIKYNAKTMKIKHLFHFIVAKYYSYSIMEVKTTCFLKDLFSENNLLTRYISINFPSLFLTNL